MLVDMGTRELEYTKYGVDMTGGPPFNGSVSNVAELLAYLDRLLYCAYRIVEAKAVADGTLVEWTDESGRRLDDDKGNAC